MCRRAHMRRATRRFALFAHNQPASADAACSRATYSTITHRIFAAHFLWACVRAMLNCRKFLFLCTRLYQFLRQDQRFIYVGAVRAVSGKCDHDLWRPVHHLQRGGKSNHTEHRDDDRAKFPTSECSRTIEFSDRRIHTHARTTHSLISFLIKILSVRASAHAY